MPRPASCAAAAGAVLLFSAAARSQPAIGPELGMDQPIVAPLGGGVTRVASNGTTYLAAWIEQRSAMGPGDVFAARVGLDGSLLDATGIALAIGDANPFSGLAVASDGDGYLVVWSRGSGSAVDLVAAQVAADGSASPSFIVSSAPFEQQNPHVAFGGGTFLVAWEDCRNATPGGCGISGATPAVYAARVSPPAVLDPSGVPIALQSAAEPDVAYDGTNFVVTWEEFQAPSYYSSTIVAARVAVNATVLDPNGIAVSTSYGTAPAAAGRGGAGSLLVWSSLANLPATRVGTDGSLLDVPPLTLATTSDYPPAVAAAASGTAMAVWADDRLVQGSIVTPQIYGCRVAPNGTLLDASGVLLSPPGEQHQLPSVASDGIDYLAMWYGTEGTRVDAAGNVLDAVPIRASQASNRQTQPAVAYDGQGYLVAWQDSRSGVLPSLIATRLDASGTVLDPMGIPIGGADVAAPTVASNGSSYLVTWWQEPVQQQGTLVAARVGLDGTVLDPAGIALMQAGPGSYVSPASAASDGTGYAVVWQNSATDAWWLSGAVLDGGGNVTGAIYPPSATWPTFLGNPVISPDGAGYLMAWAQAQGVVAARTAGDGTPVDTSPLVLSSTSSPVGGSGVPAVSCGSGTCLVAWGECIGPPPNACGATQVVGVRVSVSQGLLDAQPFPISTAGGWRQAPAAAFDGQHFLVAWQDDSGGSLGLAGTWVGLDGTVLFPAGVTISPTMTNDFGPALAGAPGTSLAVYERFDPSPPFDNVRVRARFATFAQDPAGAACQSAETCASGFCEDGVCCATACGGSTTDCMACSVAAGAAADGTCGPTFGNACDDGNPCTVGDVCNPGGCEGVGIACPPPDACHESSACDPDAGTGTCPAATTLPDGTPCPLGVCVSGTCVAAADAGADGGAEQDAGVGGSAGHGAGAGGSAVHDAGAGNEPEQVNAGCGCKAAGDGARPTSLSAMLLLVGAGAGWRRTRRRAVSRNLRP